MCRMMGVVSQGPVYYDLFEEFADLAAKGMCPIGAPDERGHKDGWGIACFQNGLLTVHVRDVGSAPNAPKYYGTAWKIAKLNLERGEDRSLIVMAHLRRSSVPGLVAQTFSHPFVEECQGETWAFQHNGSLVNGINVSGKIDSQILFRKVLDDLPGTLHADVVEAVGKLRETAIAEYGGFTGMNLMLSNGKSLHLYRDFQTNGQYYTLYLDDFGEMMIASSEPILAMKAEPIPRGMLVTIHSDLRVERTQVG
jgi:predicted glutamine amidotransferase